MNNEQLRAAFEAWATSQWLVLQRTVHGEDYQDLRTQGAWEAYQAGRAALQSQKPKANDLMLSAVIRMPFEMAMSSPISRMQFYQRAQQALNELEALQSQDREGYAGVTVWMDGAQCTKIITRIQYESSSADELLRHFEAARAAIDHARRVEEAKE